MGKLTQRRQGAETPRGEMREGILVNPLKNFNPIPSFLCALASLRLVMTIGKMPRRKGKEMNENEISRVIDRELAIF